MMRRKNVATDGGVLESDKTLGNKRKFLKWLNRTKTTKPQIQKVYEQQQRYLKQVEDGTAMTMNYALILIIPGDPGTYLHGKGFDGETY
jgi:hypothetical protein